MPDDFSTNYQSERVQPPPIFTNRKQEELQEVTKYNFPCAGKSMLDGLITPETILNSSEKKRSVKLRRYTHQTLKGPDKYSIRWRRNIMTFTWI